MANGSPYWQRTQAPSITRTRKLEVRLGSISGGSITRKRCYCSRRNDWSSERRANVEVEMGEGTCLQKTIAVHEAQGTTRIPGSCQVCRNGLVLVQVGSATYEPRSVAASVDHYGRDWVFDCARARMDLRCEPGGCCTRLSIANGKIKSRPQARSDHCRAARSAFLLAMILRSQGNAAGAENHSKNCDASSTARSHVSVGRNGADPSPDRSRRPRKANSRFEPLWS